MGSTDQREIQMGTLKEEQKLSSLVSKQEEL